ncbi:hypothetical protein ONJ92_19935, partial [Salmonella enterica subsp. enterica serovar Virginia]|nr:hypothetical protein [Salmonella enterica subsp. enterica serovar Virginia]
MHSVSFGCWTPKLRVIVYDNFNQDVYKKWLCFIKRYDLKAKRARNVKVISMGTLMSFVTGRLSVYGEKLVALALTESENEEENIDFSRLRVEPT